MDCPKGKPAFWWAKESEPWVRIRVEYDRKLTESIQQEIDSLPTVESPQIAGEKMQH